MQFQIFNVFAWNNFFLIYSSWKACKAWQFQRKLVLAKELSRGKTLQKEYGNTIKQNDELL